jgi:PhnB protein
MATTVNPYVNFDGDCESAVKFWAEALGAQLHVMRMGESPMQVPAEAKNRVMHATVTLGELRIMASDGMPGQSLGTAGPVALSLNFTDRDEQTRVWQRLAAGGTVTIELADQFWGRFGELTDKFGIRWMLNFEPPKG